VSWVRRTDEPAVRRPGDIARLVIGALGAVLVGFWAQAQATLDTNVFVTVNNLPNGLDGAAQAIYALGSIWTVAVVAIALVLLKKWTVVLRIGLAGAIAWGVAIGLHHILGDHTISGLHYHARVGGGLAYPSANVAVYMALVLAIAPYVVRPVRHYLLVGVAVVAVAAVYLGAALGTDALGGAFVGLAVAAGVLVAFGAPTGGPSIDEVRDGLTGLGFDVDAVDIADGQGARASTLNVKLTSGDCVQAEVFGRDQRDSQLAARVWRSIMYREPGVPTFGSRLQQAEHIAYMLMLAQRAGINAPRLVKTGVAGPDAAILVTTPPAGTPLDRLDHAAVNDTVLTNTWQQLERLQDAGLRHGTLDGQHVLLQADGSIAFTGFDAAAVDGDQFWRDRDTVDVLATTAGLVGNDRAITAAVDALGKERLGAVIPLVQPVALPKALTRHHKHVGKELKELRAAVAKATGVDDVQPLKIRRLTWVNIGMLVGVVLAFVIAFHSMEGINFSSVSKEFQDATWAKAVAALALYPLIPIGWATALVGAVNADLPLVPTVLMQLAGNFLNLVTPNGIGGTALQVDYLHKAGVPVASGGSAIVLSTGVGSLIQFALLLAAAAMTSTSLNINISAGTTALWAIAIVAALVGVVLAIPRLRGKVVPAVKRAATDIWAVVRNPQKAIKLFGGDITAILVYPAILGICLLAFG
jgi:undecaprenyl-diphosphatase